jgi:hypothetical protein
MRINLLLVAVAVVAFPAVAAAGPGGSGIPPMNDAFPASTQLVVPGAPVGGMALAPATWRPVIPAGVSTPRLESFVRRRPGPYRPRPYRPSAPPFGAQIHVGLFNPIDDFSTGFEGGFRVGPRLTPLVQVGLAMDWWHRSEDKVLDLGEVRAPGGVASEKLILSESSATLFPFLMFVQVNGNENMPVIPYGGVGFGYEWLFLSADDYMTDESFDRTFGGFGWQAWAGAGFALDRRTRLNAEIFFNACEVDNEVDMHLDQYGSVTVRDIIDMNGVGARFGLSFTF